MLQRPLPSVSAHIMSHILSAVSGSVPSEDNAPPSGSSAALDIPGAVGSFAFSNEDLAAVATNPGGDTERAVRLDTAIDASGNWYWEVEIIGGSTVGVGVDSASPLALGWWNASSGGMYYGANGYIYTNGLIPFVLSAFLQQDIVGMQLKNGKLYAYKNNSILNGGDPEAETGSILSGLVGNYYPAFYANIVTHGISLRLSESSLSYGLPPGASTIP